MSLSIVEPKQPFWITNTQFLEESDDDESTEDEETNDVDSNDNGGNFENADPNDPNDNDSGVEESTFNTFMRPGGYVRVDDQRIAYLRVIANRTEDL